MRTLGLATVLAVAAACSKDQGPPLTTAVKMDSPRAVADGMMLATRERNPKLAATLLAPEDKLRANLECPADELAKRVAAKRAKLDADFGQAPKDTVLEIAKFDKLGWQERQLRKGDGLEGCAAKGLLKSHLTKVELRATTGDKTEFRDDSWLFVQFGDEPTWYWIP